MARTLSGVSVEAAGGTTQLRRGSRPFAAISGDTIDLALVPDIADAILGTPGTGPSERGASWIRFTPRALDQYAQDKLRAWLTTAWRLAERAS